MTLLRDDILSHINHETMNLGGLRMLHLKIKSLALLTKWVGKLISPETDLTLSVLKDSYSPWTDWKRHMAPIRWASAFWDSSNLVFPYVWELV